MSNKKGIQIEDLIHLGYVPDDKFIKEDLQNRGTTFQCKTCGATFYVKPEYIKAYCFEDICDQRHVLCTECPGCKAILVAKVNSLEDLI